MRSICTIKGCRELLCSHGLCAMHFWRLKVHKDPMKVVPVGYPKGRPLSRETRKRMSISHSSNGYEHSEETRKKMSESLRLTYQNGRPLAKTATFRNNETGFYTSKKMHVRYQYRSRLEKRTMLGLDNDRDVKYWFYEPFVIPYWHRGEKRSYFIDLVVWYKDGRIELVEVKHSSHLWQEKVVSKRAAAETLANQLGARFKFVTEKAA